MHQILELLAHVILEHVQLGVVEIELGVVQIELGVVEIELGVVEIELVVVEIELRVVEMRMMEMAFFKEEQVDYVIMEVGLGMILLLTLARPEVDPFVLQLD
jgi:hypothetical protein